MAIAGFAVAAPAASAKDLIFWTNPYQVNKIFYANLDGSSPAPSTINTVGATINAPWGIGLDPAAGKIYWASYGVSADGTTISWANLAGGGAGNLKTGAATVHGPIGVVVDRALGRIYWANWTGSKISWAMLNNSNVGGDLKTGSATVSNPQGVAIDPATGRIYWANYNSSTGNKISFAKLDDSNAGNDLPITGTPVSQPWGVTIDAKLNRIYWGNFTTDSLDFADLTGFGGVQLTTAGANQNEPMPGAIDPRTGKIYWANWGDSPGTINVANADGSGGGHILYSTAPLPGPAMPTLLTTPQGTGAPRISGSPGVPAALSCSLGNWAPDHVDALDYDAPQTFSYSWFLNGSQITAATGSSIGAFAGGTYTCRVTATNFAGSSSQTSAGFPVAGPPTVSASASASGLNAVVAVSCHGASNQRCAGQVIVTSHVKKKGKKVVGVTARKHRARTVVTQVTVASGAYSVAAGNSATVVMPVNGAGRKVFLKLLKLPATVSLPGTTAPPQKLTFRLPRIHVSHNSIAWSTTSSSSGSAFTSAFSIVLTPVPVGARVRIGCHGGGCPFGTRSAKAKRRSLNLTKLFGSSHLRPGTRVTFAISAVNHVGELVTYTMSTRPPTFKTACLPPGSSKPVKC